MKLDDYQAEAIKTDKSGASQGILVPLTGLIGETGSLITEFKKFLRDNPTTQIFNDRLTEELGDTLWYVATLAHKHGLHLSEIAYHALILKGVTKENIGQPISSMSFEKFQEQAKTLQALSIEAKINLFAALIQISNRAGALTDEYIKAPDDKIKQSIIKIGLSYMLWEFAFVCSIQGISLQKIAENNLHKAKEMFGAERIPTPLFDEVSPAEEQFPRCFEIVFKNLSKPDGNDVALMTCNGINMGDRLTDNSYDETGYRFHDAIHYAFVAVLGWSPVMRSLFKLKRKSDKRKDEVDDGARAAIIEEAIIAVSYDYARHLNMLEGQKEVSLSKIKMIQKLCLGFEVEKCQAWEWEKAILMGYDVFRKLRDNKGGTLVINLNKREISYKKSA